MAYLFLGNSYFLSENLGFRKINHDAKHNYALHHEFPSGINYWAPPNHDWFPKGTNNYFPKANHDAKHNYASHHDLPKVF